MTARRRHATPSSTYPIRIDPTAPFDIARTFLVLKFRAGEQPILHHHRAAFYVWNGAAYVEISDDDLRAKLYRFLDRCKTRGVGQDDKIKPHRALVSGVFDALAAAAHLDSNISAPRWLNDVSDPPADEIIACANGLLHLPSLRLLPHTPAFFTHNAVDFPYAVDAPPPQRWLTFLGELWPDDRQAIETLQEIFGYCLTADTSQQKLPIDALSASTLGLSALDDDED